MKKFNSLLNIFSLVLLSGTMLLISCSRKEIWLKGNLHTHTFWSDGRDFPENVGLWYKDKGYDFLMFTDHNILHVKQERSRRESHLIENGYLWQRVPADHPALERYIRNFGQDWVESRKDTAEGQVLVRLKTMEEYLHKIEDPGKFLPLMGNEITNPFVHFVTLYQDREIPASKGKAEDRVRMMQETIQNLEEYRSESGRNTWPVLAHPNHRWSLTAEIIMEVPELRFMEIYNGIPGTNNDGDGYRAGHERIWDIVLSKRLEQNKGELIYGLATDDAHYYDGDGSGPGRGWVMVKSAALKAESILDALDKGDFYSSTGVTIQAIQHKNNKLSLKIDPKDGVEYQTEFIGTLKGFDPAGIPTVDSAGVEIPNTTRTYSPEIGKVLSVQKGLEPSYTFSGEELYVRARVISTEAQLDPVNGTILGKQKAWTQPVIPAKDKK